MYVCICNCVTDRQLIEMASECAFTLDAGSPRRFAEQVADRLGAGLGCGTCRDFAVELVERAAAHQESVVLAEHTSSLGIGSQMALRDEAPLGMGGLRTGGVPSSRRE